MQTVTTSNPKETLKAYKTVTITYNNVESHPSHRYIANNPLDPYKKKKT